MDTLRQRLTKSINAIDLNNAKNIIVNAETTAKAVAETDLPELFNLILPKAKEAIRPHQAGLPPILAKTQP